MEQSKRMLYTQLVEEYSDTVTRLCIIHTGNYTDAEDCYQNVFFKLFKTLERGEISNCKAWIIRVTLNECKSLLRYRLIRNHAELKEVTAVAEDKYESEMLELIYSLPPKYRDAIYLYYYEQLSVEEISKAMKAKESTVKSWLRRGREKLKNYLV